MLPIFTLGSPLHSGQSEIAIHESRGSGRRVLAKPLPRAGLSRNLHRESGLAITAQIVFSIHNTGLSRKQRVLRNEYVARFHQLLSASSGAQSRPWSAPACLCGCGFFAHVPGVAGSF